MTQDDDIKSMLQRIEQNQQTALQMQREHLELTREQLERSNRSVAESLELQRSAVARQSQISKFILPVIGILLLLIGYLLFRWDIL